FDRIDPAGQNSKHTAAKAGHTFAAQRAFRGAPSCLIREPELCLTHHKLLVRQVLDGVCRGHFSSWHVSSRWLPSFMPKRIGAGGGRGITAKSNSRPKGSTSTGRRVFQHRYPMMRISLKHRELPIG